MLRRATVANITAIVLVAVSYVTSAQLAVATHTGHALPSLLWAPAGIGLAAVLIYGPTLALGIALGGFISIVSIGGHPMLAGAIATVDALEALAAYYMLRRLSFHYALDRVRDVLALTATAIVVTLLSATAITGVLYGTGVLLGEFTMMWSRWWWSHLAGDLILAPLFLTWSVGVRARAPFRLSRGLEAIALGIAVLVIGLSVFLGWFPRWLPGADMPHYLFPVMLWAGLRFSPRAAATTNVAISLLAIGGILYEKGPFTEVADFQSFISISAVATLALSALSVEVSRAIRRKGAMQQAALDAIITIDANDRILELNPAAERLFHITLHDALGADVKPLFVPQRLRKRMRGTLASYLRSQGDSLIGKRVRCPAQRADGIEFPAEIAIMRMPLDDEDLFSAAIRDISSVLQAETAQREAHRVLEQTVRERTKELRRSEELMRDAQALAHLGSFDLDLKTGALSWSDEMYRIYGRDPATFKPSYATFTGSVLPADRPAVTRAMEAAMAKGTSYDFEERIVRPDGTVRTVQKQGKIVRGDDGKPVRLVGYSQDITERKLAEAARYRLVDLVESSQDAIVGLSVDGVIETWNAAAQRLFGYSADEIVGRNADILVPPHLIPEVARMLAVVRSGQDMHPYEIVHRRRDGTDFEASVTMSAIVDQRHKVIGLSKVIRDISDQKHARDLLEASVREKEVLLREIHHRVKNNLQVISSLLNLQLASVSSEDARKGLIESQSRIQSMALIHQLLYQSKDFARIDLGGYLSALVDYLVGTYTGDSDRITVVVNAANVRLDLDRSIPCGLIVNELVTNSFRHAFPGDRSGHIWVDVHEIEDGQLQLEVRDDGVGMPVGADVESAPTFGLQIARSLTHQLDGTIEIVRGAGATIRITFPINQRRDSTKEVYRDRAAS